MEKNVKRFFKVKEIEEHCWGRDTATQRQSVSGWFLIDWFLFETRKERLESCSAKQISDPDSAAAEVEQLPGLTKLQTVTLEVCSANLKQHFNSAKTKTHEYCMHDKTQFKFSADLDKKKL